MKSLHPRALSSAKASDLTTFCQKRAGLTTSTHRIFCYRVFFFLVCFVVLKFLFGWFVESMTTASAMRPGVGDYRNPSALTSICFKIIEKHRRRVMIMKRSVPVAVGD
ncbi:Ribosome-recycling factor [Fusarium oxysporum f. sp. albedinis]|nr:Ribosome-recycling factor [Fusarium oxysporum f. sp. albedinis]